MASCSNGQIGALNAESFCERVISAANLVVSDGNTLLSDKHVTMLTVLRMSRDFMEYMRANYNSERERGLHQVGGRPRHSMRAVGISVWASVLSQRTDRANCTRAAIDIAARRDSSETGSWDLGNCLPRIKLFNCLR